MKENKNNPLVSVAVITYNMAKYLPPLLDSILKQKVNFKYEIVVDDDNSPDNSAEILLDYKSRYPDIFNLSFRNVNVKASKNLYGVIKQCKGKYVAILEGDDWWEDENKLQYQFDFMENHPEYVAMYCNSWCELSTTEEKRVPRRKIDKPMVFSLKDWQKSTFFFDRLPNSTDTVFFRNFFSTVPEKYTDIFYKAHDMAADQSLALIFYGQGKVYVDPKIVSHHRTIVEKGGTNYQSKHAAEDHRLSDAYMYACHEEYIEKVLHKKCGRFLSERGRIYAESYWRWKKNKSEEDRKIAEAIYNQRDKRFYLKKYVVLWGLASLGRKIAGIFKRKKK